MLLHATEGPGSWLHLCRESFSWICRHHGKRMAVLADAPLADWVTAIQLDARWKGKIRKASHNALAYHTARATHKLWQQHFNARLARHGAILPDPGKSVNNSELWQCELCTKTFGSTRALAMPSAREHGYRKKVRYFAVGDTCHVCLQLFHNRTRLGIHYEKNEKCYATV